MTQPASKRLVTEATGALMFAPKSAAVDATDTGYDVVLVAGQSNAVGQATGYDSRNDPSTARVATFNATGAYANQIVTAADPLAHPVDTNGAGPAVMFGQWLLGLTPANRRVLLVPAAANATAFETGVSTRWKVANPDDGNNLFENAMRRVEAALTAAGANSRLAAVVWVQGESDALGSTDDTVYRQDLIDLIDAIRNRVGNLTVPFLVGQMLYEFRTTAGPHAVAIDAVHQAIGTLRAYTAFAAGPGAGNSLGDGLHYNLAGQTRLARSLADAFTAAKNNTAAPATPVATPAAPGQVTGLSATAAPVSASLAWSIPSSGTSPITDYRVEYRLTGGSSWTVFADGVSTGTAAVVTGLTASAGYDFRVTALNAVGTGTPSATATATPTAAATVPAQVTGLTATAGPASAALAWSLPADGGAPIADYAIQYRATGGSTWTTATDGVSTARAASVAGLTNGAGYDFRVAAINSVGTGAYSTVATATPSAFLPGAVIADNFNRANGAVGASPTGGVAPAGAGAAAVDTNRLKMTSPSSITTWNPSAADYTFQATAVDVTGASVGFRSAAGVGFYEWNADGTVVKFPGVTVATVGTFSNGDVVKIRCAGNTFTCYVNGVQVGAFTDASNPTGGAGFGSAAAGGIWDDMSISTP